ncbi:MULTISPECIES: ABC transporter substrate-binding protein [Streptomyces]|uniref:ABC transporter substrate-binding protein n=1 Tax=Streptomyces TaxID=1883 RepID=UPI000CD55191|nr:MULTISPECIES: ABC transporter substrate-binding protein [Streptomyces]
MDTQTVKSTRTTIRRAPFATAAAAVTLALALTACGGDSLEESDPGSDTGSETGSGDGDGDRGSLIVGSADFTEATITAELYAQILADAGYDTSITTVRGRELYEPALESGEIDIVPEYLATMTEFLNRDENGPDAEAVASSDADETRDALVELAEPRGLKVLDVGDAVNQNAFAVSEEFADEHGLSTLTDLGESGLPVTLAAGEDCVERPFCQPGLEDVYGIDITEVDPKGVGTAQTKQSVQNGTNELALVTTTDGTLPDFGLVLLDDDQNLQQADNILPVVNADSAGDDEIAEVLNKLTATLTTEDLVELNRQVDAERVRAADAARDYLVDKGLIDG